MIALDRYRRLFSVPGLGRALMLSIVGRMPIGISGLAILLFVQTSTGSFTQAGVASALYVVGLGVIAPGIGRCIDRFGPHSVLAICSVLYPTALLTLVAMVIFGAQPTGIAVTAFVAGAVLPPVTICVRALLPRAVTEGELLQTAYSVDSALVEAIFILGPALVAVFVAAGQPAGAVVFAAICAAVGGPAFLRSSAIRNWVVDKPRARRDGISALCSRPLLAVFLVTLFYSIAFGLYEVGVTAYATRRDSPALAGVALALASAGSAAGAIVYGSRRWAPPLTRQFVIALGCMAAGILIVAPVHNDYLFAAMNVVAGAPMATVIASQSLLVSRLAPRHALAEAFTWGSTCLLGGIGAGIAIGGILAEMVSPQWIIVAAAAATLCAAVLAAIGVREPEPATR